MEILTKPIRFLLFFFLLTIALYYGRPVIVPFCIAGLLAMLFLPLSRKLESHGLNRGLSALTCVLIFLLTIAGIFFLLSWQISDLSKDLTGIEQRVTQFINSIKQFISRTFGITEDEQKKIFEKQKSSGGGQMAGMASSFVGSLMSVLVNFVLVIVYIFLLLYFRLHIRKFILKLVPATQDSKTEKVIDKASGVAQKYLMGLAMMIASLWVLYGIGFSIVGVKHAIFFAMLCGLLEIVPFVGNITGTTLTIIATLAQGGSMNLVLGVLIVYGTVQFIQTYILETLVVGAEVNINPLATIVVLVVGETIWGIAGMVLAIPLLGIVKIICDHVEPLKPYGFLIGEERKNKTSLKQKILDAFKKKT